MVACICNLGIGNVEIEGSLGTHWPACLAYLASSWPGTDPISGSQTSQVISCSLAALTLGQCSSGVIYLLGKCLIQNPANPNSARLAGLVSTRILLFLLPHCSGITVTCHCALLFQMLFSSLLWVLGLFVPLFALLTSILFCCLSLALSVVIP